jgi:hypothetical protein
MLLSSDKFWKGQVKSMKMDRQFKPFERSIDGWKRKRFLTFGTEDYRNRSRFAEFVDQIKKTHS